MNSKIFNFNFFKENLKKSKGLLAFFFGVIPFLNIIITIIGFRDLIGFNALSTLTFMGLYIVPIIFALSLFTFIFSKKSTDFVMSKPISRKTLYLTNILGGIIVLLLFTLLNTILFGIMDLFMSELTLSFSLLFDYFLFWFISYLFVFAVTVLSITLAGNAIGSIIIILIIICMYPFLDRVNALFNQANESNYIKCTDNTCATKNYICDDTNECLEHLNKNEYQLNIYQASKDDYTTPVAVIKDLNKTMYDISSMIKMLILSIIYLSLGYFTFKSRKMENNEISFKSEFVHYLVKTITFLPVTFIAFAVIDAGGASGLVIALVASFIYYIIYDLITRKAIYKFLKSTCICLISFIVMVSGYYCFYHYKENHDITIDKIDNIILGYDMSYVNIKDKDLINAIIKDTLNNASYGSGDWVTAKSGNNKYNIRIKLSPNSETLLQNYIKKEQESKIANFNYQKINYIKINDTNKTIPITKEIKKLLKEAASNINIDNIEESNSTLTLYNYHNHDYEKITIPYNTYKPLDKYIMNNNNKEFLDYIEKNNTSNNFYLVAQNGTFGDRDNYIFDYVINKNLSSFIDYIKNNNNKTTSNNCYIEVYGKSKSKFLLIGDSKSFKEEFDKYTKNLENDNEYQKLIERYNSIYEVGENEY